MTKRVVGIIFLFLFIGLIALAVNIKSAYKALPMETATEVELPPFADWREFTPQAGKFKVLLPIVPQYAKAAVEIPNTDKKRRYEMYISEKVNGTIFMISVITYPPDFDTSDKEQMLNNIINELVTTNAGNRLKEIKNTVYQGHQAIDFNIANKEFDVQGKTFMIDKTVYFITYIARLSDVDNNEYNYFIKSFQIIP